MRVSARLGKYSGFFRKHSVLPAQLYPFLQFRQVSPEAAMLTAPQTGNEALCEEFFPTDAHVLEHVFVVFLKTQLILSAIPVCVYIPAGVSRTSRPVYRARRGEQGILSE